MDKGAVVEFGMERADELRLLTCRHDVAIYGSKNGDIRSCRRDIRCADECHGDCVGDVCGTVCC